MITQIDALKIILNNTELLLLFFLIVLQVAWLKNLRCRELPKCFAQVFYLLSTTKNDLRKWIIKDNSRRSRSQCICIKNHPWQFGLHALLKFFSKDNIFFNWYIWLRSSCCQTVTVYKIMILRVRTLFTSNSTNLFCIVNLSKEHLPLLVFKFEQLVLEDRTSANVNKCKQNMIW